jgi:TatD DNase family protein
MELVDVHCHLEDPVFDEDREEVIREAEEAGIISMITASTRPGEWSRSREIARAFDSVEYAVGVHPWFAGADIPLDAITPYLEEAVAMGEIGLDSRTERTGMKLQVPLFEALLELAREEELPVIVHCLHAFDELIHSLKRVGPLPAGGIIHSFNGSRELARQLISHGFSFSLGAILTKKSGNRRREMMDYIYPDHFLLESDSPAMPPAGVPGRNRPVFMIKNLEAAAHGLRRDVSEVAAAATANSRRIFGSRVG